MSRPFEIEIKARDAQNREHSEHLEITLSDVGTVQDVARIARGILEGQWGAWVFKPVDSER